MARPDRRIVEIACVLARQAETPDDQDETDQRYQRVEAAPGAVAHAFALTIPPFGREDPGRMNAEEKNEPKNENDHATSAGFGWLADESETLSH